MDFLGWARRLFRRRPRTYEIKRMPVGKEHRTAQAEKTIKSPRLLPELLLAFGIPFWTPELEQIEQKIPMGAKGWIEKVGDKYCIDIFPPCPICFVDIHILPLAGTQHIAVYSEEVRL